MIVKIKVGSYMCLKCKTSQHDVSEIGEDGVDVAPPKICECDCKEFDANVNMNIALEKSIESFKIIIGRNGVENGS